MNRRTTTILLSTIVLAAAGIRILAATRYGSMVMYSDMAHYNDAALSGGFPTSVPPAYPLFLRLIYGMFGTNNFTAVFITQALIGALAVLLMYRVTARIGTPRAGLLAAGISAFYPNFIAYTTTVMTETIGVFFVILLMATCVEPMSERRRSIATAVALCASLAFRPVMLLFAPGTFLGLKKRLAFVIALAVCLLPFVLSAMLSGSDLHRGARGLYRGYNPQARGKLYSQLKHTELGARDVPSRVYISSAISFIKDNKWNTLDIMYAKATVVFDRGWDTYILEPSLGHHKNTDFIMSYAYMPVMVLGFIGMIRRYNKANRIFAFLALSYLLGCVIASIFKVRYRLLVEPILIVYASVLIADSFRAAVRWRGLGAWYRRLVAAPEPDPVVAEAVAADRKGRGVGGRKRWALLRPERDTDILLVLFGAAVAIRLYLAITYLEPIERQETLTLRALALDGGLSSATPPLYPLFLRLIYSLSGGARSAAVYAVQGVLNALLVFFLYSTAARLGGRRAGIIAASIALAYPGFLGYNLAILAKSLIVFLVALFLAVTTSRMKSGAKAIASGSIVGAGILTQATFVCFVPGIVATMKRWRLFILVLMVLLVPYVVRNISRHERIQPLYRASVFNLNLGNFTESRDARQSVDLLFGNASAVLRRGPLKLDRGAPNATNSEYVMLYGCLLIEVLGLIGIVRYWSAEHRPVIVPFLLCALILILFSRFETWHRAPFEPLFIAYAGILLGGRRKAGEGDST